MMIQVFKAKDTQQISKNFLKNFHTAKSYINQSEQFLLTVRTSQHLTLNKIKQSVERLMFLLKFVDGSKNQDKMLQGI